MILMWARKKERKKIRRFYENTARDSTVVWGRLLRGKALGAETCRVNVS